MGSRSLSSKHVLLLQTKDDGGSYYLFNMGAADASEYIKQLSQRDNAFHKFTSAKPSAEHVTALELASNPL